MEFRRTGVCVFAWVAVAVLILEGCRSAPSRIEPIPLRDDFGDPTTEDITEESVSRDQMLRQRAQAEIRLGAQIPFDVFRADVDPEASPAVAFGGKFDIESFKNLFFGATIDWSSHDVDGLGGRPPGEPQIENLNSYDRWNFLLGFDYDTPLWEDEDALIFRFGLGLGVSWVQLGDDRNPTRDFEDLFQFLARPSVGLRYPISDGVLLFGELSYDIVPERNFVTTASETVKGTRAVFSAGAAWVGLAFEWD